MDANNLCSCMNHVSGSGLILSCEQRAALDTSLLILRRNYSFSRVLFWGKMLGLKADYFIAQGVKEDEMRDKKTLYSLNCVEWHLLPPVTAELLAEMSALKVRFTGDPSFEYERTETRIREQGDETVQEEITVKINEEQRLSATVFIIEQEASVVPRGAFIKTPEGRVQINCSFQGLSWSEVEKLSSYFHFSEPQRLKKKSILEMAHLDPSIDFLDTLSDDVPEGSWSLQLENGSRVVVLRSLIWLGLTFFHMPLTPQHGYIYMGDGMRNLDLPFML